VPNEKLPAHAGHYFWCDSAEGLSPYRRHPGDPSMTLGLTLSNDQSWPEGDLLLQVIAPINQTFVATWFGRSAALHEPAISRVSMRERRI
jgi:hypothetical protein